MPRSGLPALEDVLAVSSMGGRCPRGCVALAYESRASLCSRMSLKSSLLRTPVWGTLSFVVLGNPGPGGLSSSSDHRATPPSPHCVKGVLCHHATPHFLSTVHRNVVVLGERRKRRELSLVTHAYNSSTQESEAGGLL